MADDSGRTVRIARQGWPFIGAGLAAFFAGLGALVLAGASQRPWLSAVGGILCALGLGFAAFCLYFFRDPDRPGPLDADKIYAPGQGVVLSVGREGPGDGLTLRIFLSIFDVHVQRAPCAGKVVASDYVKGSFLAAMKDQARGNERSIVTIQPEGRSPVVVEQIAGLVARRIETWVGPGDRVLAGQRYGIIYFGSQVAVHFPPSARCVVKPGDRVVSGVTPVGEWA